MRWPWHPHNEYAKLCLSTQKRGPSRARSGVEIAGGFAEFELAVVDIHILSQG